MKKDTRLNDIRAYIFLALIAPIKRLGLSYPHKTPLRDKQGRKLSLKWYKEDLGFDGGRNFQRRVAEASRNYVIVIKNGEYTRAVGYYDKKSHQTRLFRKAFENYATPYIMGLVQRELHENTPFTKVIVDDSHDYERIRCNSDSYYGYFRL